MAEPYRALTKEQSLLSEEDTGSLVAPAVYMLILEHHWEPHTSFVPRLSIPDLVLQLLRKIWDGKPECEVSYYCMVMEY